MARARKKRISEEETETLQPGSETPQEMSGEFALMEMPKSEASVDGSGEQATLKQWSKAPNPFPSIGYYWQDYTIQYQENHERNTIQIKFGDGSPESKPMNFAKIEPLLKANGLRWNSKDKAWTIGLEWQVKNSEEGAAQINEQVRRQNAKTRGQIENLLPEIVKLEEEVRGPVTGRRAKPPEVSR